MPTTSNFGWTTPADTDLVKDGAAAIRTLGNNIDASLVDLKGGTTGQVLAKASNADLDYTWSNVDPLTILDAKGDLITATAADTPTRLAVGTNNTVLTADSTTATGLKWATVSANSMTELASGTLSTSSVTISNVSQSYNDLILVVRNFFSASTTGFMRLRYNANTSNYDSTGIQSTSVYNDNGGTGINFGDAALTILPASSVGNSAYIRFNDYTNTTARKTVFFNLFLDDATSVITGAGSHRSNDAITSVNLYTGGQDFGGGTYILYGVK